MFDKRSEDIIGTTGGTTVYFASGSLSVTSAIATTHFEEYKERLIQTWMPVNAKVNHEDVSNKDLIQQDLFVNHVSARDVNILHYILNIKEFHEETKMKVTISNDKEHKRHYATLSSVIAKLKDLKAYSKANILNFINNEKHLDLPLPQEFLKTDSGIQDLWLFLSWFLQFIFSVALFPVEGGHKAMVMMKFFWLQG